MYMFGTSCYPSSFVLERAAQLADFAAHVQQLRAGHYCAHHVESFPLAQLSGQPMKIEARLLPWVSLHHEQNSATTSIFESGQP